jgi:hypothetical protein
MAYRGKRPPPKFQNSARRSQDLKNRCRVHYKSNRLGQGNLFAHHKNVADAVPRLVKLPGEVRLAQTRHQCLERHRMTPLA